MSNKIENKVVLVTGANRGIGKTFVEEFIKAGAAKVYAAVRKLDSAQSLVDAYGDKVVPIVVDLVDGESVLAAAKVATDVDIVVNNGGMLLAGLVDGAEAVEELQAQFDTNVFGLVRMAQAFGPILKANGGGVFAQLNSIASVRNFPGGQTYSVSKAAAYSVTQGLRDNWKDQGTQVISVHPGPIATDMAKQAGIDEIAEPTSVVSDGLFAAIEHGEFHVFPDTMAKQVWEAYQGFGQGVVEQAMMAEG